MNKRYLISYDISDPRQVIYGKRDPQTPHQCHTDCHGAGYATTMSLDEAKKNAGKLMSIFEIKLVKKGEI